MLSNGASNGRITALANSGNNTVVVPRAVAP